MDVQEAHIGFTCIRHRANARERMWVQTHACWDALMLLGCILDAWDLDWMHFRYIKGPPQSRHRMIDADLGLGATTPPRPT